MYDYKEAVKNDVLDYIRDEVDFADYENLRKLEEFLNEELLNEDSVTGNASGSYTFNRYEAEENICCNLELLGEALDEFDHSPNYLIEAGAEGADVLIRCFVLPECIKKAIKEIEEEFEASKDEEYDLEM